MALESTVKTPFLVKTPSFDSFVPWRDKISWIRALGDRIHRICSKKDHPVMEWLSVTYLSCAYSPLLIQRH